MPANDIIRCGDCGSVAVLKRVEGSEAFTIGCNCRAIEFKQETARRIDAVMHDSWREGSD